MSIQIQEVTDTEENGRLIMSWRNDPITRQMSYNQEEKIWDDFGPKFSKYLQEQEFLFAYLDKEKIAFVSFSPMEENKYLISINMNPNYRGKRLSTQIIQKSLDYIQNKYPEVKSILAEIKKENIASQKTFRRAGFELIREELKPLSTPIQILIMGYLF